LTNQSLPVLRWLILFVCLIPLYFILKKYKDIEYRHIFTLICVLCLVYYIGYLGQGLYSENILKISRYDSQGFVWAGSSIAVLPFIIGLPCGMWLFNHQSIKLRVLGILVGVSAVCVCFYYESRILIVLLACCLIVSVFVLDWRKALVYIGIIVAVWVSLVIYTTILRSFMINMTQNVTTIRIFNFLIDTTYFTSYTDRTGEYITYAITGTTSQTDVGRVISILAPFNATDLFGHGTYLHHTVLPPYFREMAMVKSPDIVIPDFIRTTGFASYLTDYGFIGLGLLIINFIFVGLKLILNRSKIWLLIGVSLCFCFGWLFVSNILDNVLWWLLIVPFGLLEKLNDKRIVV